MSVESWLNWKPLRVVIWGGMIAASVSLFRSTLGQATDFEVFWRVGQALQQHQPIYSVAPAAGMVFKYPPWIAPFFYLFGFVDFVSSKGIWALVELFSLLSIVWTLRRHFRASEFAIVTMFALYWGLWVIHFLDGQITLPILALFLHFLSRPALDASARGLVPVLMSTKIFTLFPLLAVGDRFKSKRAIYSMIMLGVGLSWATAMLSYGGRVGEMLQAWAQSASSGGQALIEGQTRGPKNQSIVSYVCRLSGVPAQDTRTEVVMSLVLFAAAFALMRWRRSARAGERWGPLSASDEVFCYLALTAPLHPLPWHHLFVWTFPLAVSRFDCDRRRATFWLAIFLLTLSSARALPLAGVGDWLEWNVGRAWGALLLVGQTLFARKK